MLREYLGLLQKGLPYLLTFASNSAAKFWVLREQFIDDLAV